MLTTDWPQSRWQHPLPLVHVHSVQHSNPELLLPVRRPSQPCSRMTSAAPTAGEQTPEVSWQRPACLLWLTLSPNGKRVSAVTFFGGASSREDYICRQITSGGWFNTIKDKGAQLLYWWSEWSFSNLSDKQPCSHVRCSRYTSLRHISQTPHLMWIL